MKMLFKEINQHITTFLYNISYVVTKLTNILQHSCVSYIRVELNFFKIKFVPDL